MKHETPQQRFLHRIALGATPEVAIEHLLREEVERVRRKLSHTPGRCARVIKRILADDDHAETMGTGEYISDGEFLRLLADCIDLAGGEQRSPIPRQNHSVARRLRLIAHIVEAGL